MSSNNAYSRNLGQTRSHEGSGMLMQFKELVSNYKVSNSSLIAAAQDLNLVVNPGSTIKNTPRPLITTAQGIIRSI